MLSPALILYSYTPQLDAAGIVIFQRDAVVVELNWNEKKKKGRV